MDIAKPVQNPESGLQNALLFFCVNVDGVHAVCFKAKFMKPFPCPHFAETGFISVQLNRYMFALEVLEGTEAMNLIIFFRNGQTTWALKASMIER